MNVIQMEKGKERWSMIADNIWDMILGKSGQLPGPVAQELVDMAKAEGREFETNDPQSYYPDKLEDFKKEMQENGWELGEDNEELFELAMHPEQYRAYKSGKAKADFEKDLAERKAKKNAASSTPSQGGELPSCITVTVGGVNYEVKIAYDGQKPSSSVTPPSEGKGEVLPAGEGQDLLAPLEGKFYLVKDNSETPKKVGDSVQEGDVLGYIEAMKTFNAIRADKAGVITAILVNSGDAVEEDDPIMKIA
jgi:pyruvate carboxylase subunit B